MSGRCSNGINNQWTAFFDLIRILAWCNRRVLSKLCLKSMGCDDINGVGHRPWALTSLYKERIGPLLFVLNFDLMRPYHRMLSKLHIKSRKRCCGQACGHRIWLAYVAIFVASRCCLALGRVQSTAVPACFQVSFSWVVTQFWKSSNTKV